MNHETAAHREWHANNGVPMGTPGCPQDACHPPEPTACYIEGCDLDVDDCTAHAQQRADDYAEYLAGVYSDDADIDPWTGKPRKTSV